MASCEIHIEQQYIKLISRQQLQQAGRLVQGADRCEMALEEQAGRLKDVLLVVHDQYAGRVEGYGFHVSESEQCPVTCTPPHTFVATGHAQVIEIIATDIGMAIACTLSCATTNCTPRRYPQGVWTGPSTGRGNAHAIGCTASVGLRSWASSLGCSPARPAVCIAFRWTA